MSEMFCFQCEQTAGGAGCRGAAGVCGKRAGTANLQDGLTGNLIELAHFAARAGKNRSEKLRDLIVEGLFMTLTNVNFDDEAIRKADANARAALEELGARPARALGALWTESENIRSLKSLILFGLRGVAAYARHALKLGYADEEVDAFFFTGLAAIRNNAGADELLSVAMKTGEINLKCMALLERANTETYGDPHPANVAMNIEKGPFIVVTGHDLYDLKQLLEQTEGTGVQIYTHGEMLPAHGYPKLKAHPHLRGHFGTAWQNQQKEFDAIPAPVLFTTNCLMPPRASYGDRVFTSDVVGFPGACHIGADRDFAPVIEKALALGGYAENRVMRGVNGGSQLTTGFAKNAVLSHAGKIVEAVKRGKIRHFFLVGGCDGAKPGRDYYTEFVKNAPQDTVILTLGCGKFRFNDLRLGEIDGIPRLLDLGQCNDAYGAVRIALALSEAFDCSVNELPLTLVLSWYEQKAVCILLTLLSLGIQNMYIGPSLPAFISPAILTKLAETYKLKLISTPEADLAAILAKN